MNVNFKQKSILIIFAIIIIVLCVGFVPWINKDDSKFMGYSPIWKPPFIIKQKVTVPKKGYLSGEDLFGIKVYSSVDTTKLKIEVFIFSVVTGICLIFTTKTNKP